MERFAIAAHMGQAIVPRPVAAGPVHRDAGLFQVEKPASDEGLDEWDGDGFGQGLHETSTVCRVVDAGGLEDGEALVLFVGDAEQRVVPRGVTGVVDVTEEDLDREGLGEEGQARLVDARLSRGSLDDVGHEVRVGGVGSEERIVQLQHLVGAHDFGARAVEATREAVRSDGDAVAGCVVRCVPHFPLAGAPDRRRPHGRKSRANGEGDERGRRGVRFVDGIRGGDFVDCEEALGIRGTRVGRAACPPHSQGLAHLRHTLAANRPVPRFCK